MGNLVTLTVYSDRIDEILANPKKFVEELAAASNSPQSSTITGQTKVQGYRHSSEPALYVQIGNTCCILDAYSGETRRLVEENKKFYGEMVSYAEKTVRELRLLQNGSR